jgi:hypothetical protein
MKKLNLIVTLLFCIYFLPSILFSQEPPDDATTIVILTTDKVDAAFRNIGRLLVKEGFELETTEPTLMMLTTKVTEKHYGFLGGGTVSIKLSAQVDEADSLSKIILTGKFLDIAVLKALGSKSALFDKDANIIEYGGMSGSSKRSSWNIMDELAKKYKNANIKYEVTEEKK